MRRSRIASLCAAVLAALQAAALASPLVCSAALAKAAPTHGCPAAPAHAVPPRPLPALARAMSQNRPVTVLAVGSALQAVHMPPADSFPARTLRRLREAAPGQPIDLRVSDLPGASAADMLPAVRRALQARPAPTLLLWQTGTVDAAKRVSPQAFGAALRLGLRAARDAGTDVVLVDPLYTRLLQNRADVAPYEDQLAAASTAPGVDLFSRHALMWFWVASRGLDIEATPRPERARTLVQLQDCLAVMLARQIVADVTVDGQDALRD